METIGFASKPMYNESLKFQFLTGYVRNDDVATAKTYMYDLARIKDAEDFYSKDIFNFTYDQLEDTFRSLQAVSFGAINRIASCIRKYIEWAVSKGYVPNKIDIMDFFAGDNLLKYVNKKAIKGSICTREEMYAFCDALVNPIDRIPILLAFEGIKGPDLTEMLTLRYTDIDESTGEVRLTAIFTDETRLPNGKAVEKKTIRERTVFLCERSIDIIMEAKDENVYYKKNGLATNMVQTCSIVPSDFVIKKTNNSNLDGKGDKVRNSEVSQGYVESKVTRIFKPKIGNNGLIVDDAFITTAPFMNLNNLFKSGIFSMLNDIEQEKGEISTADYQNVCVRYGLKSDRWAAYKSSYLKYKEIY